jgi:hypothetical protein
LHLSADQPRSALAAPSVLEEAAREAGATRLFHDDAAGVQALGNGARWGYRNARGFSYQVPSNLATLLDLGSASTPRFSGWPERLDPRLLRLLGVGVYVGAAGIAPPPGFAMKPFAEKDGLAAWKALEPPFETAVVSDVVVAPSPELEASSAISIDTATTAVVAHDVGLPARAPGSKREPAGTATLARLDGGQRLVATVRATREALLVIGEGFHQRWRASALPIGAPADLVQQFPVVRTNATLIGVRLPSGSWTVELTPASAVRWWMWLAMLGGIVASAALWPRGKIRA